MIDYKLSKYNFTFPYPKNTSGMEQTVMYNIRTGSIALIEPDKYQQYLDFAENGVPVQDAELLSDLKRGGYVVEPDLDELAALKYRQQSYRFNGNVLSLTIAPTSDCNFRCIYCYEKDSIRPITMSEKTQDQLIDFVQQYLPFISSFRVVWYGGEPLLAMHIIEKLSKVFMDLSDENHVNYSASIVTNGYLLTPEIADQLRALNVNHMQITLDGAAEDHDKRRFLKGGLPTFDRIIENLCAAKDHLPDDISIRINADRHNIDRVDNVVKIIREKGLEGKVYPYIAMVENRNNAYNDNSCLHTNRFSQYEFDFIMQNKLDIVSHTPQQLGNYCGADSSSSFVINADGKIYKCWNEMGIESCSIGNLEEGVKECALLHSYLLYDATADPECSTCKFLPVCMGGCPYLRRKHLPDRCTAMKHGLHAFMSVIPAILEKQLDEETHE